MAISQSSTTTTVVTEIVTSIQTSASQPSSTQTSSLPVTQISAQQSTLSTQEGQNPNIIFANLRHIDFFV